MEPLTANFLAGLATNLTTLVIQWVAPKVKKQIVASPREKALERCIQTGIMALATSARVSNQDELILLQSIFEEFFNDEDVAYQVAGLLAQKSLNLEEIVQDFEKAGFNPETLPGIDPKIAFIIFESAFKEAAFQEAELLPFVEAGYIKKQTQIQQDLLNTVRELVTFLRNSTQPQIIIQNGLIIPQGFQSGKPVAFNWHKNLLPEQTESLDPKRESLRKSYLNYIFQQVHHLTLTGIDPKAASDAQACLDLDAVYTALLTQSPEEPEKWQRSEMPERDRRLLSALEQANQHQHLVLLGDPGSGKTTFVRFLALCLCGQALDHDCANLKLLTAPIPQEDEEKEQIQPWRHGPLLPVQVILRDFAARGLPPAGAKATAKHLWDFIVSEMKNAKQEAFAEYLDQELRETGGLLLIDGLDEVPEADQRRTQIKQAVEDFAAAFAKCRILVTSRTYAYQRQDWRLTGFKETVLAPFTKSQIRKFIEKWYAYIGQVRHMNADDAKGRAELLKRAVFGNTRLYALAERPLLLTLMASLHAWRGGTLPEQREELYADAVDLLLDWWEAPKTVLGANGEVIILQPSLVEWLRIDRKKVREFLNETAFNAHTAQPDLVGTADIPEKELIYGLMKLNENKDIKPRHLIDYLSNRAGLLLPRGNQIYTFPHRTFQEYLAACHLTDNDYPDQLAERVKADPQRWREVALLAAAKAATGAASTIWSLVEALCDQNPPEQITDLNPAWSSLYAGQALVETNHFSKVPQRHQEKIKRVKTWLLQAMRTPEFPPIERANAGNALAQLGDPRPEVLTVEDMKFCLVPSGKFWLGSPDDDDLAYSNEKPCHQLDIPYDFWLSRYPVTNAQFQQFVDDEHGYCASDWWTKDGLSWRGARKGPDKYGGVFDLPNHPVVMVCWYEALAFTRWLTTRSREKRLISGKWELDLPSEAEWEKAARGGLQVPRYPVVSSLSEIKSNLKPDMKTNSNAKQRYPWGTEAEPNLANYDATGINATSTVGCFPKGYSVYGCEEISGNVWEFTRSLWGTEIFGKPDYKYPYNWEDGRENSNAPKNIARIFRGGAFLNDERNVRCALRSGDLPGNRYDWLGFRVVLSLFTSER